MSDSRCLLLDDLDNCDFPLSELDLVSLGRHSLHPTPKHTHTQRETHTCTHTFVMTWGQRIVQTPDTRENRLGHICFERGDFQEVEDHSAARERIRVQQCQLPKDSEQMAARKTNKSNSLSTPL